MKTYLIRLYNKDMQITLEDKVEAPNMPEAIEKARILRGSVNKTEQYCTDFVLKAVTIHQ